MGLALNALDVALLVVLAVAAIRGIRAGALAQVLPIGGLVLGLGAGAAMAPVAERLVEGGTARVVVSLVAVFGAALLCAGAGQLLAMRLGSALDRNLAVADAVLGAGAGVVLTAVALWLVASMLVSVRSAAVAPRWRRATRPSAATSTAGAWPDGLSMSFGAGSGPATPGGRW